MSRIERKAVCEKKISKKKILVFKLRRFSRSLQGSKVIYVSGRPKIDLAKKKKRGESRIDILQVDFNHLKHFQPFESKWKEEERWWNAREIENNRDKVPTRVQFDTGGGPSFGKDTKNFYFFFPFMSPVTSRTSHASVQRELPKRKGGEEKKNTHTQKKSRWNKLGWNYLSVNKGERDQIVQHASWIWMSRGIKRLWREDSMSEIPTTKSGQEIPFLHKTTTGISTTHQTSSFLSLSPATHPFGSLAFCRNTTTWKRAWLADIIPSLNPYTPHYKRDKGANTTTTTTTFPPSSSVLPCA